MFNKKGVNVLINGNTVTTTGNGMAISKDTIQSLRKWSVTVKDDPHGYSSIGIAKANADLGSYAGADNNGIGILPSGAIMQGGVPIKYGLGYSVGDTLKFTVDGNKLIYSVNGSGHSIIKLPKGKVFAAVSASSGGQTTHVVKVAEKSLLEKVVAWLKW